MSTTELQTDDGQPTSALLSRRTTLGAGLVSTIVTADPAASVVLNSVVESLVKRSELQAKLFNSGEMLRWLAVADPGESFTLMQPFGGPTSHGFDRSPRHLGTLASMFRNGNATIELARAVASDDGIVLVYIERQQIEVAGLPKQDWSLRVTQVFQREGADWKLVHRHADPLVHPISLAVAAALASGKDLSVAPNQGTQ